MTLGDFIKSNRKHHGLTQRALAELVGISPTTVSHLEADRIKVSDDLIKRIGNHICVSGEHFGLLLATAGIYNAPEIKRRAYESRQFCMVLQELSMATDEQIMQILKMFEAAKSKGE